MASDRINLKSYVKDVIAEEGVSGSNYFTEAYSASDTTSNLSEGTVLTFRLPACLLSDVRMSLSDSPTGSSFIVDIQDDGVSIFSTLLSIDVGEKTSTTSSSQFAFSSGENYLVGEDSEIKIIITQVGAANTGKHLIVRVSGTLI